MRIFNKLVFSKKEPSNKNDIWFDGKDWKVFIDGEWKDTSKFKEDATTPDWNAQKGEAGYIENKPFSTKINTTVYEFTNGKGVQDNDNMNIHVVDEDGNPFDIICFRTPYDFIKINDGDTYDYENSPLKTNRRGVHIIRVKYTNGWLDITLDNIDYNNYLVDWFNYDCYVGPYTANNNLIEIPHYYIPDTIIKTTPQSLSDTAKNQVKENLGISTPDWNAKAGEPEYIENKPFEENYILKVTSAGTYTYTGYGNITYRVKWVDANTPGSIEKLKTDGSIITVNVLGALGKRPVTIQYTAYNSTLVITDQYSVLDEDHYIMFGVSITQIPEYFIPDTVLKTTPQGLSSTDKNQALTNLGIKIKADGTLYIEQ